MLFQAKIVASERRPLHKFTTTSSKFIVEDNATVLCSKKKWKQVQATETSEAASKF